MTLYQNRRAWRARLAQAAIWAGTALCLWLALYAPPNANDNTTDAIVVWSASLFMLCAAVAFEFYLRLYVLRIVREGERLHITTLATVHHRRLSIDAAASSFSEDHYEKGAPGLAPGYETRWRGLRAPGQRLAFIVDTTA